MLKKVLGLEVHAQIATSTKLFSRSATGNDKTHKYHKMPNANVEWLDAGFPGTLPVPNKKAIDLALRASLALNMTINKISVFDRKHYFYPDLPLGYQISQFYKPIGVNGYLECSFGKVRINRLHIECDAGKTIHEGSVNLVDMNRCGVPLMEIVTEPDFSDSDQVVEFLKELKTILIAIGASNCDMEEGNFRADVNLSLHNEGEPYGTRVEIKNLNSFRFIARAIEDEANRQQKILESGGKILQETRLFDVKENKTKPMREKEDQADYRYFPDPDLLPIRLSDEEIENTRKNLPELPQATRRRWQEHYKLDVEQSRTLSEHPDRIRFFEKLIEILGIELAAKISNWVCSELLGQLAKTKWELESLISEQPVFIVEFARIIELVESGTISRPNAKIVLEEIILEIKSVDEIVTSRGLADKIEATEIMALALEVIGQTPKEVEKYRSGKTSVLMFFVGQIMKKIQGKGDPEFIKKCCIEVLEKD